MSCGEGDPIGRTRGTVLTVRRFSPTGIGFSQGKLNYMIIFQPMITIKGFKELFHVSLPQNE